MEKQRYMLSDSFWGNENVTKTYDKVQHQIVVINDGIEDVKVTAGKMSFVVKKNEVFEETVPQFVSLKIETTSDFRVLVRR